MSTMTMSDWGALAAATTTKTPAVRTQPVALIARRRRQPGSRVRSQCLIIPAWLIVKSMNTPTAYSGISRCVSPWKAMTSRAATTPRMTIPEVNASRSPRKLNWRGMNPSSARIATSRGNALKLVFAARNRSSAVKVWNR